MSPFKDYFIGTIKHRYANFEGRARRSEYWYFALFNFLTFFLISFLSGFLAYLSPMMGVIGSGLMLIFALALFIPGLAVAVRRLHDTDKSGWMLLLGLIPIIGAIALLVFYCTDSQAGSNKYGPNPKVLGSGEVTDHLIERV